ncbi:ABC transporter ATP-binding protein [Streptomyces sp. NBC_00696]|uniref:ABC transporter ATP-binding protein n=1 Tax=Streptomyces sp. NBC_00696 TaxID=2903672 RepID=UPI002E329D1A|nr:ABC transporter ATP-binding protein [Streptomyces sp. NBC_00696]
MPDITVESLSTSYGSNRVLDEVSFTVHDREFLTLLGPSGCGKTTTLMSVAGFLRPDHGVIRCGDQTFIDRATRTYLAAEDRNIGIVFQSYAIWPHMTVFDNVAFPLKVRKVKRAAQRRRIMDTLDLVEMADYAQRYPHELSGGQQQRVALARALVYSPSVLLLDEPFSNLDAKLRERARTWLIGLQRDLGLTTLFVTHDQDEALSLSDRIVVMNKGSILQVGTPKEIYGRPDSRFVAEFLGRCNVLSGEVSHISGGTATVVLDTAPLPLTLAVSEPAPSGRVDVVVRPEAVVLSEEGDVAGRPNTYPAKVTSTAYLGDHYLYEVDCAGMSLSVTQTEQLTGTELNLHIPRDAGRIFPA